MPDDLRDEDDDLHEKQLDVLTRLRLLSTQRIVEAAEAVHLADHELIDAALSVNCGQDPITYGTQGGPMAPRRRSWWTRSAGLWGCQRIPA